MTLWRTIGEILAHWTDTVATGVIALASRFFSPRLVRLIEDDKPDTFALEGTGKAGDAQRVSFANGRFSGGAELADSVKGSRIELVLRPSRFLVINSAMALRMASRRIRRKARRCAISSAVGSSPTFSSRGRIRRDFK